MKGATTLPLVSTTSPLKMTIRTRTGNSHSFLRARTKLQSSAKNDIEVPFTPTWPVKSAARAIIANLVRRYNNDCARPSIGVERVAIVQDEIRVLQLLAQNTVADHERLDLGSHQAAK